MFIWGDESNYEYRAINAGFIPRLITSAIHYHPFDRQIKFKTAFGRKIAVPNEDWKLYCLIRNRVYNSKIKRNKPQTRELATSISKIVLLKSIYGNFNLNQALLQRSDQQIKNIWESPFSCSFRNKLL